MFQTLRICMKNLLLTLSFLFFFSLPEYSSAQKLSAAQQKKVNDLFAKRSVVYFKFQVNSVQEAQGLSKTISIDGMKGTSVSAHATKDQFSKFIVKNFVYTVDPPKKAVVKATGKAKPKPKAKKK